jgi:hypothetical protein
MVNCSSSLHDQSSDSRQVHGSQTRNAFADWRSFIGNQSQADTCGPCAPAREAEFPQQFVRDALYAPRRILPSHPADQQLGLKRNRRAAMAAFATPVKLETLAVPEMPGFGGPELRLVWRGA